MSFNDSDASVDSITVSVEVNDSGVLLDFARFVGYQDLAIGVDSDLHDLISSSDDTLVSFLTLDDDDDDDDDDNDDVNSSSDTFLSVLLLLLLPTAFSLPLGALSVLIILIISKLVSFATCCPCP